MNVLRLKKIMLINKVEFLEKTVFFLIRPETYQVMYHIPTNFLSFKIFIYDLRKESNFHFEHINISGKQISFRRFL